jgi:3-deoxy-7-phosphoheptulonate synthase
MSWSTNSWKNYKLNQNPDWKDIGELENVKKILKKKPALVFSGETRKLKNTT